MTRFAWIATGLLAGVVAFSAARAAAAGVRPTTGTASQAAEACPDPETATVEEQRACGEEIYRTVCWDCHEEEDGSGTILDRELLASYNNAFAVYDYISYSMPEDDPGILPLADYWAVTAYLLDSRELLDDEDLLTADTAEEILLGN